MDLMSLVLNCVLLVAVLGVTLCATVHFWFCKSNTAKSYANIPAYGTRKPILLLWQYFQQVRNLKGIPLLAYFLQLCCAQAYMFQSKGIAMFWLGFAPYIGVYKAEYIKTIINSRLADDKSKDYFLLHPLVRTGLATSNGEKYRNRRKLLQPAFHSRILEDYISIFNEHSLVLVNKLKKTVNEPWIDISHVIVAWALDIICHTAMGIRINAQEVSHEAVEYVKASEEFIDLVMYRLLRPWFMHDFIFHRTSAGRRHQRVVNSYQNFTRKVIQKKKEAFKLNQDSNENNQYSQNGSKSFLEVLLEHHTKHPDFTLDDVQEEVDTFMFAGHDTSTIVTSWALYLISLYPDIQENVFRELWFIFGDDKTRDVTSEDLKNMVYLEQVIKEALRLYPAGPIIIRQNEESIKIGPYSIPAGSRIAIFIYMLHRDPEVFPNPEKFDPERFSSENIAKRDPFSYIPFSAGTRACIGQRFAMMEMKIGLSHVIRNFKVTTLDPRDKMNVYAKVTLRCLNPIRLRFSPRP